MTNQNPNRIQAVSPRLRGPPNYLGYEGIGALVVALLVAALLFRVFFERWRDYFVCCSRFLRHLDRSPENVSNQFRGTVYNAVWLLSGVIAFCFLHRVFA